MSETNSALPAVAGGGGDSLAGGGQEARGLRVASKRIDVHFVYSALHLTVDQVGRKRRVEDEDFPWPNIADEPDDDADGEKWGRRFDAAKKAIMRKMELSGAADLDRARNLYAALGWAVFDLRRGGQLPPGQAPALGGFLAMKAPDLDRYEWPLSSWEDEDIGELPGMHGG